MNQHESTRREALVSIGIAAAAGGLIGRAAHGAEPAGAAARRRVLRVAHLTDSHIQPERGAFDGVTACLRHMMALKPRPDLVMTGGDLIMDSFEAEEPRSRLQWELFTKVYRDECGVPVLHCLGNHDIWGWDQRKSKTTSLESRWGKRWAMDTLGLQSARYAIDRAGWRIIVLDSVAPPVRRPLHGGPGRRAAGVAR